MDSFMFQTVGHDALPWMEQCFGLPMIRRELKGGSLKVDNDYLPTKGDEVEDLYELLLQVQNQFPEVQGVSVGAILSNYQRVRVENVCRRLGWTCYGFLWRRDQKSLLQEMSDNGLEAILIKVAAMGLKQVHLGKTLREMFPILSKISDQYGAHMAGEGGEYETLTLDCPAFKKRLVLDQIEVMDLEDQAFAPVAYLRIKQAHTEEKPREDFQFQLGSLHSESYHDLKDRLVVALKSTSLDNVDVKPGNPVSFLPPQKVSNVGPFLTITATTSLGQTISEQTTNLMNSLTSILKSHNLSWNNVLATTVLVSNMSDFAKVNVAYGSFFQVNPPTRVTVQCNLTHSLQIDLVATREDRETMHVESISYWAPANIGPYCQTSTCQGLTWVAGQIGLIPDTMVLPNDEDELDGLKAELQQSLLNLHNVVEARNHTMDQCLVAVAYTSSSKYFSATKKAWETTFPNTPLCLVSVPALPRNAKIEWQTWFVQTEESETFKKIELEDATIFSRRLASWKAVLIHHDISNISSLLSSIDEPLKNCILAKTFYTQDVVPESVHLLDTSHTLYPVTSSPHKMSTLLLYSCATTSF